jgi:hypothetical protein
MPDLDTPLGVAVAIAQLVDTAGRRRRDIDLTQSTTEIFLRHLAAGCSRRQIADALASEAEAAGIMVH